jgi:hypothetical protein
MLFSATTTQHPKAENRCGDNGVLHEQTSSANAEFRSFTGQSFRTAVSQSPCLLKRRAEWLVTENHPERLAYSITQVKKLD